MRSLISVICLLVAAAMANLALAQSLNFELRAASRDIYAAPHDIVLNPTADLLYVADNGNNRIAVLDPQTLDELGSFALDEVRAPHDVVFDHRGRLLVADTGNHRIAIYEIEGVGARFSGAIEAGISSPEGVTVDSAGRVLVTGAGSGNLVIYEDGAIVNEARMFSSPHDVEVDALGNIWVADSGNHRMIELNAELDVLRVLSGPEYAFNGPRYLDFDRAGLMYIADKYTNSIKIVDQNGRLVQVLGSSKAGKGPGVFDRPEGVEILGSDVWFSDTYNHRIVRYRVVEP